MSIANTTNTALQSLLNFSQQSKSNKANFAEFYETNSEQANANSANNALLMRLSASDTQASTAMQAMQKIAASDITNVFARADKIESGIDTIFSYNTFSGWGLWIDAFTTSTTITTSVSVSNLLSQESDSTLPLKAFLASELSDIDRTQLEALSKDVLQTELEAKDGFKTIFFRDAQSFEFTQDTLSEASIQALKDEFGEESFLEREDGSLVLTGKAEKFVSGWQKALSEANSSEISLDELVKKDANFDGELDSSEISTSQSTTIITQITQETLVIVGLVVFIGYLSTLHDNEIEAFLADFHSLAAGFAFENLSTTSKAWFEELFPQLFGEKSNENSNESADTKNSASDESNANSENVASDESAKQFNKAKFDEFYANFKASFNSISASFMGLKSYQASSLSFEKLSLVAGNLAQNFINDSAQKV